MKKLLTAIFISGFLSSCAVLDVSGTKINIVDSPLKAANQSKTVITLAESKQVKGSKARIDFTSLAQNNGRRQVMSAPAIVTAKFADKVRLIDFYIPGINDEPELSFVSTARSLVLIDPLFWGISSDKQIEIWQAIDSDREFNSLVSSVANSDSLLDEKIVKLSSAIALRIARQQQLVTDRVNSNPSISRNSVAKNSSNNTFSGVNFPLKACGDSLPTDINAYPVNFYPVYIEASDRNLKKVKSEFCQDAYFKKRKDTGKKAIQVSSFVSLARANDFKYLLEREFGFSEVGSPTIIEQLPRSQKPFLKRVFFWLDKPAHAQSRSRYKYSVSQQFGDRNINTSFSIDRDIKLQVKNNQITVSGKSPVAQQLLVVAKNRFDPNFGDRDYASNGNHSTRILAEKLILPTQQSQSFNITLKPKIGSNFKPSDYVVLRSEGFKVNRSSEYKFGAFDYNLVSMANNIFTLLGGRNLTDEEFKQVVSTINSQTYLANNCQQELAKDKSQTVEQVASVLTNCLMNSGDTASLVNTFGKLLVTPNFEDTEQQILINFIGEYSAKSLQNINLSEVAITDNQALLISQNIAREIVNGVDKAEFSVEDLYAPKNFALDCIKTLTGQFYDLHMDCYGGSKVIAKNYSNSWYEVERTYESRPGYDKFSIRKDTSFIRSNLIAPGQRASLLVTRPPGYNEWTRAKLFNKPTKTIKVDKLPLKITRFYGNPTKRVTINCSDPQRVVWSVNIIPRCTSEGIYIDLNSRVQNYTKVTLPGGNIIQFNLALGGMRHYITSSSRKIDLVFSAE